VEQHSHRRGRHSAKRQQQSATVCCHVYHNWTDSAAGSFNVSCYRMQWTEEGSVFGAISLCFLFVYEISLEQLTRFVPNSNGRRVWSLTRTHLKVKVKGQGHNRQKWYFLALLVACMQFMFGKTCLASSLNYIYLIVYVSQIVKELIKLASCVKYRFQCEKKRNHFCHRHHLFI